MPALGVGKITDFTQLQMIDFYACVECGRCTNMCPATGTGKMLSPMDLITKLRDQLNKSRCARDETKAVGTTFAFNNTQGNQIALAAGTRRRNNGRNLQPVINRRCHYRRRNLGLYNLP